MKKTIRNIVMAIAIAAFALLLTVPTPTEAASKKPASITASTKEKNVTVKKVKTGTYTVTMQEGTKNAAITVKDGKKVVTKSGKWKSSNKKVVTVKNNKLTAVNAGSCKVTFTYKGKKTVFNVTVTKKPCKHKWKKHWTIFEEENTLPDDQVVGVCSCGVFDSEKAFKDHLWEVTLARMFNNNLQMQCGLHGTAAKSLECLTESNGDTCHYKIKVKYIDYMYCTKCDARLTSPM